MKNDNDFNAVLICAVRYCLGRRTYMPSLVTEWIMHNMHGQLPKKDLNIMLDDIESQRGMGLGDPCDVQTWNRFEEWLLDERTVIRNDDDINMS